MTRSASRRVGRIDVRTTIIVQQFYFRIVSIWPIYGHTRAQTETYD